MLATQENAKHTDRIILVFVFAVFVFVPPLAHVWASPDSPWYLPYVIWLGIIALIGLATRAGRP